VTNILRLVSRVALTVALLALLVLVVAEPGEIAARLAQLSFPMVLAAIGLTAADRILMAYKWRLLLAARGVPLDLTTAIRAYCASSFAGLFLPVTVGADAIRVLAVRRLGAHDVTASIVVERSIGALAVGSVALLSCAILARSLSVLALRPILLGVLAIVVGGTTGVWASFKAAGWTAERRGAPTILTKLATAYAGYRRHRATLALFYGLSVAESFVPVLINYVAARGLGLEIPFHAFVATIPLALTLARLPISLGGFGVQEASFVYLAGLLGVPASDALATMLVSDAVLLVTLAPAALDVSMLNVRRHG
jgi:uncharacterized membrane protein YbhN (UPF0104 family)